VRLAPVGLAVAVFLIGAGIVQAQPAVDTQPLPPITRPPTGEPPVRGRAQTAEQGGPNARKEQLDDSQLRVAQENWESQRRVYLWGAGIAAGFFSLMLLWRLIEVLGRRTKHPG
jgi:hypothetical protein